MELRGRRSRSAHRLRRESVTRRGVIVTMGLAAAVALLVRRVLAERRAAVLTDGRDGLAP